MADINKTNFIKTYGIDDDKFIDYLNKFATLKKIVAMERLDVISKEKLNHLYNRFIYYNSLGHDLDTIVDETTTDVRTLFFFNGNGYFEYRLPNNDITGPNTHYSYVTISDRICQIKIMFTTKKTLNKNDVIFDMVPAPVSPVRDLFYTNKGIISLSVMNNGIVSSSDTPITENTNISGTITYIIKK